MKSTTKSTKKTSTAKRFKAKTKSVTVPRGVRNTTTGFPRQLNIVHKYVEGPISFDLVGATPSVYQWSVNGMFKPNVLSAGHQPFYFDQMAGLYNQYCVVSSTIKIEIVSDSAYAPATSSPSVLACAYIEDQAIPVTPTSIQTAAEQASATPVGFARGGDVGLTLYKSWNARQAFGIANPLSNDELKAIPTFNPYEQQYYTLFLESPPALTARCNVCVTINYTAVWLELLNINKS